MEHIGEFERQIENLISKGYSEHAGESETAFKNRLETLRPFLPFVPNSEVDIEAGKLPFVIVIKSTLVASDIAMSATEKNGKHGITKLYPHQPTDFAPIAEVEVPNKDVYLLIDIDRGKSNINLPPNQAFPLISHAERTPLTIDEGIALITHFPEFLYKNNCFSLLASRHEGDQRVPAIWINGQKEPNLGWCWDGNPHTWLGSASAKTRLA